MSAGFTTGLEPTPFFKCPVCFGPATNIDGTDYFCPRCEQPKTPPAPILTAHNADYKPQAWQEYTLMELGAFVHLFVKRAKMRANKEKAAKDLYDAQNYLAMMQAHIDAAKEEKDQ